MVKSLTKQRGSQKEEINNRRKSLGKSLSVGRKRGDGKGTRPRGRETVSGQGKSKSLRSIEAKGWGGCWGKEVNLWRGGGELTVSVCGGIST